MTEPQQKPGRSKQDYGTPPEFVAAVKWKLGIDEFRMDLAATAANRVASSFYACDQFGDSLTREWPLDGWNWLNPPFSRLAPWVQKAYETAQAGGHVAVLVPAGVGANWWRDWVHEKADVLLLNGRLTFVGCEDPYPKDCALLLYSPPSIACRGSYDVWTWQSVDASTDASANLLAARDSHADGNA
jgi:phage N-6-adenine-methyltransferase